MRRCYPVWARGKRGYARFASAPNQPTTVVLYIDGTLVDTNYQHALAWHRALCAHDYAVQLADPPPIGLGDLVGAVLVSGRHRDVKLTW